MGQYEVFYHNQFSQPDDQNRVHHRLSNTDIVLLDPVKNKATTIFIGEYFIKEEHFISKILRLYCIS